MTTHAIDSLDGAVDAEFRTYWTLPTRGDPAADGGRRGWTQAGHQRLDHPTITDPRPGRFTDFDHLVRVARAADASGFDGLIAPYDPGGEESWVTATALAGEVSRLRFITEFQPGFATAVYTAKLSLSFQRYFADRLGWKPALGTPSERQRAVGDFLDPSDRIARARELLAVAGGVWNESGFTHHGDYFEVEDGGLFDPQASAGGFPRPIGRRPHPEVVLDGHDEPALALSAEYADVHLFNSVDPTVVRQLVARHRSLAAEFGRTVRYGVRLAVLARETGGEAWRDAVHSWRITQPDSTTSAADLDVDVHRVDEIAWNGFDRLGLAVHTGLIGSFADVAWRLSDLRDLGVSVAVLDGVDHVGDAFKVGEFVLPLIRARTATVRSSARVSGAALAASL